MNAPRESPKLFVAAALSLVAIYIVAASVIAVRDGARLGGGEMARPADTVRIPGVLNISGNVGIGTTQPKTKLHLTGGKIYVEANGQGIILKSPGGACFELTVTDTGVLTTVVIACL